MSYWRPKASALRPTWPAHWVTIERWDALRPREIDEELRHAHALILEKLPPRTKNILAMPEKERAKVIREHKAARREQKDLILSVILMGLPHHGRPPCRSIEDVSTTRTASPRHCALR